jgi:hypothetical protein
MRKDIYSFDQVLYDVNDLVYGLWGWRMAPVCDRTASIKRSCQVLSIETTYEAFRLEFLELVCESTDITNLLTHDYINQSTCAHHS